MQHMKDLRKFFNRLRKHSMRLNTAKCTFGVKRGKVPGYMGKLQYISRFINQLTSLCEPMFKLMKKNADLKWDSECQITSEKIETYLVNPPILCLPHEDKPLLLYLTVTDTSIGAMLAQEQKDSKVEHAIYFVSRKLQGSELIYSALEKTCTSLVWVVGKLKHYIQSQNQQRAE